MTCGGAIHAPLRPFDCALELNTVVACFIECFPQLCQPSGAHAINLPYVYVNANVMPEISWKVAKKPSKFLYPSDTKRTCRLDPEL